MILIEKTQIMGLEPTIRGMRNPMNSWAKSDTTFYDDGEYHDICGNSGPANAPDDCDMARAGSADGKFRRMIAVYVDITTVARSTGGRSSTPIRWVRSPTPAPPCTRFMLRSSHWRTSLMSIYAAGVQLRAATLLAI